MPGAGTKPFGKTESRSLIQFRAKVVGGKFVGFVEDDQIPSGRQKFALERTRLLLLGPFSHFVSRQLVEPHDEMVNVFKRIASGCCGFQIFGEDAKFQTELLEHLAAPLLHQTTRRNHENTAGIGPHDEFANVKASHDGLAGAGVVSKHKPQRLLGEHRLVDGGDLVGQRLHVRSMDGHHGVKEEGEVDALGLDRQLERITLAVERPRALHRGDADVRLIATAQ